MPAKNPCKENCGRVTRAKDNICGPCKDEIRQKKKLLPCHRCKQPRGRVDAKYCLECEKIVKKELEESGYLQEIPKSPAFRPVEKREITSETKFGSSHG